MLRAENVAKGYMTDDPEVTDGEDSEPGDVMGVQFHCLSCLPNFLKKCGRVYG